MKINDLDDDLSTIYIHNVYNFSLIFYSSRNNSFSFSKTRQSLIDVLTIHHILFEDFNFHHFFLKWFVEIDATCSSEWAFKHNKKARFNIDAFQEIYHARKSHNSKYHRFHVYDDSFDRQIETLHDEIWFESSIKSYFDLDSHTLRNRVEVISNFSKRIKIDRFEKNKKSLKERVDFVTLVIDSRNRWIRVWSSKISAIDDKEDRILNDTQSIR